jgi:S-adenosylmethionine:tRNA ribosyltransferase-isomerase
MDVREFDFDLPADLIAQAPSADRTAARLLHLDRQTGAIAHGTIAALPDHLRAGDLLVVNNTRVFPARLLGRRVPSGGAVECLLVRRLESDWSQTGVRLESDSSYRAAAAYASAVSWAW